MTNIVNEVLTVVSKWLACTQFSEAYLFGSLLHRQGSQFDPQLSDIDIICIFRANDGYLERWKSVQSAAAAVGDLNLALLRCLGRQNAAEPIASLVPVSATELEGGLHKDKAPQFFSHNEFLSGTRGILGPIGKEHGVTDGAVGGALDSFREAQRARNKILAVSPSGSTHVKSYDGPDVLPKTLARCAAQTRWALTNGLRSSDRFDVNEGILYLLQLLTARRHEAIEVNDVLERVIVRMGGRGRPAGLSPVDHLTVLRE